MIEIEAVVAQGTLKAVCSRDELTRALGVVSRGVSTRTTVQILAGILIEADGGKLNLAATDMELSLRTSLEAQVESDGSVVVPGRLLLELARLLPDAEVTLEHKLEEAAVEIRCGSATYRLHTYNAEDFPRLPEAGAVERNEIERESFLETVARVSRSASRDESRPVLTGVLMRFEPGKLVMAATDSYRLSVKETPLEGAVPELEAIVPRALSGSSRGSRRQAARSSSACTRTRSSSRRETHCSPHGGSTGNSRTTSSSSRRRSTTRSRCRGTSSWRWFAESR